MNKIINNCCLMTDGEQIYYFCSGSQKNKGCYFYDSTKTFGHHCAKSQWNIQTDNLLCVSNKAIKHLNSSFLKFHKKVDK
jgi:hypothetical protein